MSVARYTRSLSLVEAYRIIVKYYEEIVQLKIIVNQGVVTISLPDVALSSNKDLETFWNILDERLELCHKALQLRHERLSHVRAKNAPILWQHGALARLDKDDTIHELLHHGYSTISLGYAGLYECVKYMTGLSHIHDEEGFKFGKAVMQRLNDACNKWKAEEDIDYSVYGTPMLIQWELVS